MAQTLDNIIDGIAFLLNIKDQKWKAGLRKSILEAVEFERQQEKLWTTTPKQEEEKPRRIL